MSRLEGVHQHVLRLRHSTNGKSWKSSCEAKFLLFFIVNHFFFMFLFLIFSFLRCKKCLHSFFPFPFFFSSFCQRFSFFLLFIFSFFFIFFILHVFFFFSSFFFVFFFFFGLLEIRFFGLNCFKISCDTSFFHKKHVFEPSRGVPLWALFSFFFYCLFSFFYCFMFFFFFFLVFLSNIFLLLALVLEFDCFLRSRCSMEMWCPDDIGRDSWDWVGPPAQCRARFNFPEWRWRLLAC